MGFSILAGLFLLKRIMWSFPIWKKRKRKRHWNAAMPDKENLQHLAILCIRKDSYPYATVMELGYLQTYRSWQACGNLHSLTPPLIYGRMCLTFVIFSELLRILTSLTRDSFWAGKKEKEEKTDFIFCSLFKARSQSAPKFPRILKVGDM